MHLPNNGEDRHECHAGGVRGCTSPALPSKVARPTSPMVTFNTPLSQRRGGVPDLGGTIAMGAIGRRHDNIFT